MKKNTLYKILVLLFLTFCPGIYSNAQISFTNYSDCDYIVFCEDTNGDTLWMGTSRGLEKRLVTDGSLIQTYTSSNGLLYDKVKSILIDSHGKLWCGYGYACYGLSMFDGTIWKHFNESNGLECSVIEAIAEDLDGNVWFGTGCTPIGGPAPGGALMFDGSDWFNYSVDDGLVFSQIMSVAVDQDNNKWFGSSVYGLSKFDGSTWISYDESDGLNDNHINELFVDNDNNLWIGNYGLAKFNGSFFQDYSLTSGFSFSSVKAINQDSDGNMWFSSSWDGIYKFDGTEWTNFMPHDGLACENVWSIAIDIYGNKWFGTDRGVSKFDNINWWNSLQQENCLLSNYVYSSDLDTDGSLWFGTRYGISRFYDENWTNYSPADGLPDNFIHSVEVDNEGNKWFGTNSGVIFYDNSDWITYTTADGLSNDTVYDIKADAEGNIWFGTQNGLCMFDGSIWTDIPAISSQTVFTDITIDNNGFLCVSYQNYLYRYVGTGWEIFSGGLCTNNLSIYTDNFNNIWIGQDCNLTVHNYDDGYYQAFSGYPWISESYGINAIAEDSLYNIWIGTLSTGITYYDGYSFSNYTTGDGLAGNVVSTMLTDDIGRLWIGCDGLSRIDYFNSTQSIDKLSDILIYPNPASDYIKIALPAGVFVHAEIYSPTGQLLISENVNSGSVIDISSFSKGLYLLRIKNKGVFYTKRIVKA